MAPKRFAMPKPILEGHSIYVAHQMLGFWDKGPVVRDERDGTEVVMLNPNNYADKIRIYERQVQDWFLKPARLLLDHMDFQASFVILSICLSYLEGVEQYRRGEQSTGKTSRSFFSSSFLRVFGEKTLNENQIKDFYKQARCGLFHDGMTRSGVIAYMNLPTPINVVSDGRNLICFQPELLFGCVQADFDKYIKDLRSDPVFFERVPGKCPPSILGKNFYNIYKLPE